MPNEDRLERLELDLKEVEKELAKIKTHVTNHIPHLIADVKASVDKLSSKIKPLEYKNLKSQGVHEFLNVGLKAAGLLAAVVWTFLQIADKFNWFGL